MKKLIFTSVIVLFTLISFSQKARFGIVGSPEINWMKPDTKDVTSKGIKFGISYGLNFDIPMGNNAAFSSGIFIDNCGGKIVYNDTIPFFTIDNESKPDTIDERFIVDYKLQYLSIPLGLKLKTNEIGYITYFANVGLTPQLNIGAKAKVESNTEVLIDNAKIPREITTVILNYFIGAGIEYSLSGSTALLVAVYYNNGFMDLTGISVDKSRFDGKNYKIILNNVALKVGIMF